MFICLQIAMNAMAQTSWQQTGTRRVLPNGKTDLVTTSEYDTHGNLVRELSTYYPEAANGVEGGKGLESKTEYTYDDHQNCILSEDYEKVNGQWVKDRYEEYSDFNEQHLPKVTIAYKRNEDGDGYVKESKTVVLEYLFEDLCPVTFYVYHYNTVKDEWEEESHTTTTLNERGHRHVATTIMTVDMDGETMTATSTTQYEYYYEPVTLYKSIETTMSMGGMTYSATKTSFEYEFNEQNQPIEQRTYNEAGELQYTLYYTYSNVGSSIHAKTMDAVNSDRYFDLNGRMLMGKPSRKGVYIHNGKKMIWK